LKRAACLLAAVLLILAVLPSAYAETTAPNPQAPVTTIRGNAASQLPPEESQTEPPTTTAPPTTTTTEPATFPEADLSSQNNGSWLPQNLTPTDIAAFGALAISLLALLFAFIALARSGRKSRGNLAGNYQKYF